MPALGRPRRSCLAVPGSSVKMLGKAQGLPADQVFLDLEDAVAPLAKPEARKNIVAALNEGDWAGKTRVVRVNDLTTPWTYTDVIEIVEGAGANVDAIAAASPRVETIIFGPADFMASINMKSLVVGSLIPGYPGDPYHYIL